MIIAYMYHMHGCMFCAETNFTNKNGVAACVNQWEVLNYRFGRDFWDNHVSSV